MIKNIIKVIQNSKQQPTETGMLPISWAPYKAYLDIDPTALIAPTATLQVYSLPPEGQKILKIGSGSHIFGHFAFLRDDATIEIGNNCQIGNSHLIAAEKITVGDDVMMAWGCTLIDTDTHATNWEGRKNDVQQFYDDYQNTPQNPIKNKDWSHVAIKPVKIEGRCWIGFNSIILKGVKLGKECVVGAGSVVTKPFAANTSIGGNPSQAIKK